MRMRNNDKAHLFEGFNRFDDIEFSGAIKSLEFTVFYFRVYFPKGSAES